MKTPFGIFKHTFITLVSERYADYPSLLIHSWTVPKGYKISISMSGHGTFIRVPNSLLIDSDPAALALSKFNELKPLLDSFTKEP